MIAPGITLYLARHGETEWNVERRFQGSKQDSPLTDRGREQARTIAKLLGKMAGWNMPSLPRFIASPAPRARATMEIILRTLDLPVDYTTEERIIEIDLGDWSGLTREEAAARDPDIWQARSLDRWNTAVPGGESYAMAAARAKSWLESLQENTVAVSHGGFGRIARGIYTGLDASGISALDEPQDCVFRLRGNAVERIENS